MAGGGRRARRRRRHRRRRRSANASPTNSSTAAPGGSWPRSARPLRDEHDSSVPALAGVGVVVTRAEEPGGPLARRLTRRARAFSPGRRSRSRPPDDPRRWRARSQRLDELRLDRVRRARTRSPPSSVRRRGSRSVPSTRVATVGRPHDRGGSRERGLRVDHVPRASLARLRCSRSFARQGGMRRRARPAARPAPIARPDLADGLAALGATVDRVTAYRIRPRPLDAARCRAEIASGEVDVITFTSPSAVASVVGALGATEVARRSPRPRSSSRSARRPTHAPSRDRGRRRDAEARPSTLDGVVAATDRRGRAAARLRASERIAARCPSPRAARAACARIPPGARWSPRRT